MQTVSQVLRRERARPRHRARYRHKAIFVRDPLAHSTPLDRNARARLLFLAKRLERRTKGKGRANGALGGISLTLLEALFSYANRRTGRCFPSYLTLQAMTGLSGGSIAAALRRLERAGIIKVTRRLKRIWIDRMSPITGQPERIMATVQDSDLYGFSGPAAFAGRLDGYVQAYAPPPARKIDVLARLVKRIQAESTDRGEIRICINISSAQGVHNVVASREEVARKLFGDYGEMYDSELYQQAERYERATKKKGCRNGALGVTGVEIFRLCLLFADEKGAVDLDPARVAEETDLALSSVYAALKRLTETGALIRDGKAYRVNLS